MYEPLRIKIASLKAESRLIKNREMHETDQARKLRLGQQLMRTGLSDIQRARILNRAMNRGIAHFKMPETKRPANAPKPKRRGKIDYVAHAHIISSIVAGNQAYLYPPPEQSWVNAHDDIRADLHEHRVNDVRGEARAAHLAYGFLRGVPYRAMEQKSYTPPPWMQFERIKRKDGSGWDYVQKPDPIERMALKYGGALPQDIKQRLAEWKDAAGAWVHPDLVEKAATRP